MSLVVLRPSTNTDNTGAWAANTGTMVTAADPGGSLIHDDDTTYIARGSGGSNRFVEYQQDLAFAENIAAITSIKVKVRIRVSASTDTFTLGIYLAGSSNTSSNLPATTSYVDHEYDVTSLRPGGGVWSEEDLRTATCEWRIDPGAAQAFRVTSTWLELDAVLVGAKVEAIRRVLSRRLRLLRRPLPIVTLEVGPEFWDVQIGTVINLSHFAIPSADGSGAGTDKWKRRAYILTNRNFDPMRMRLGLTLVDIRHYGVSLWDVAISEISSNKARDGIPSLDAGASRTFTRGSSAWVADPSDGRIVEILTNAEKNTQTGHLIEASGTNHVLNACFASGVDSDWTLNGEGLNGSDIADDTSDTYWDTDVTAQSCKMTAGNPLGGTALSLEETTGTITANTVCCFSTTHKDDSSQPLSVELQRAVDSWYYNAATPAWQAGQVWNALTTRADWTRDAIKNIDVGGTNTTITFKVAARTNAEQINHVSDVQLEGNPYPTSRIKTLAATVTRADDQFYYSNESGTYAWFPTRGTAFIIVIPEWDTADLPSGAEKTIFYVEYSAGNYEHVYYDEANARWRYDRSVASTVYSAYKATTVTAGTEYRIAARWASDFGELGLSNYTISLFVDDVKGTDDTAVVAVPSDTTLEIGRKAADTNMLDSWVKQIYITPQVLTDQEIARSP